MAYVDSVMKVREGLPLRLRPGVGTFVMLVLLVGLGFFLIYPVFLILATTFNTAPDIFAGAPRWGLGTWRTAFSQPQLFTSLWNTFFIFAAVTSISFPTAVLISWALARIRIRWSHGLEFGFWVAYMVPNIAVTVGWIMLADPQVGMLNTALRQLPFIDSAPLNIYSVPGIIWVQLVGNAIAPKVMLLTPAFRNMNLALEEAARVGGASNIRTMLRITFPVMLPAMALVFALNMLNMFRSFEIEQILGTPIGFWVYSTLIFDYVRQEPPQYGHGATLATLTLVMVALIIPIQRWLIFRKRYTTITSVFRPGLIDVGAWRHIIFTGIVTLLALLTIVPFFTLVVGSVMTRVGFFSIENVFTLRHWEIVLGNPRFISAGLTTLYLASSTAIISPILFSIIAYVIVRTRLRGRTLLDSIIWMSGAIPGMLSGLGLLFLFLGTPLKVFYGTIVALIIVVILQGNTTGTQITKGVIVQIGQEMEEAARVSGAGWIRTYFRIWVPLLMPTLILVGTLNFVIAANTTSSIILLASRDTKTLSILALQNAGRDGSPEAAGIISIFIIVLTVGVATLARAFGLRLGVQHR